MASFNQKHRGRKMIDEEALLRDVTPNLRADIYMHICDDLVRSVPVFQACRPSVMRVLVPSLVQEVYPPGEVIFNEASRGCWQGGGGGRGKRERGRQRCWHASSPRPDGDGAASSAMQNASAALHRAG